MPTLLAKGGEVDLWAGWSITLPPSHHTRNDDGSWSAWGADWAIDVRIIEVGAGPDGQPADPTKLLGVERPANISGNGWIGFTKTLVEQDGGKDVFRAAGSLAARNTLMSCWVSYFTKEQGGFADGLIQGVTHRTS